MNEGKDQSTKKVIALVGPMSLGIPKARLLTLLARADGVVAVDGGYKHVRKLKLEPDFWIGDGDSLSRRGPSRSGTSRDLAKIKCKQILLPKKKDVSDLEAALQLVLEIAEDGAAPIAEILLLGFQGGRQDHEFLHLIVADRHLRQWNQADCVPLIRCLGPRGEWIGFVEQVNLQMRRNQIFSIVSLDPHARLSIRGAEYSVRGLQLCHATHGLSNRARGAKPVVIAVRGAKKKERVPCFVFIP